MKVRVLNLLLLIVIAAGGVSAWRSGSERYQLTKRLDRLTQRAGDLRVPDRSKIYLQAIPTNESLHFAWRIHLPGNVRLQHRVVSGIESSGSSSTSDTEFIARARLREDESGMLRAYFRFFQTGTRSHVGDAALARLLRGRWDKIRVNQLGSDELVSVDPTRRIALLELSFPPEVQAAELTALPPDFPKKEFPVFFKIELGPPATPVLLSTPTPAPGE